MAQGKKTGGRKAGTPNKTTASAKEALGLAFNGIGGVAALETWAKDNQAEFYKLWGRLVPTELSGKTGVEHSGSVDLVSQSDRELIRRYINEAEHQGSGKR